MFKIDTNTPADEINRRIARFQSVLQSLSIDGALILQNTDLYYFSGTIQQSHLYVPAEGEPLLMARKSFERAKAESPLTHILPLHSPKQILGLLKDHGLSRPRRLGLELDVLPTNLYFMYRRIFEGMELADVSHVIRTQRAIKSDHERTIITEACRRADQVAAHVTEVIKEGMTEIDLAGQVEAYARRLGHQGLVRMRSWGSEMFYGHLLTGASAAVPSYLASPTGGTGPSPAVAQGAGFTAIARNEPILVDYVFALNGYLADHTRIFALGPLPDDLMSAHAAMCDIQEEIKAASKPGVKAGYIYDLATELAAKAGYSEHFMGVGPQRIRFVGHGIGLELDEYPILAHGQEMALQEGMIIAFEPKLIFPGKGVVGIENTLLMTDQGFEQLTRYPDEVTVIER